MKTDYDKMMAQPQIWIELDLVKDKVKFFGGIVHAGSSREDSPFNLYNENLFLVIEGEEQDLWQLAELLKKMTFHLPTDKQHASTLKYLKDKISSVTSYGKTGNKEEKQ